MSRALTLSVLDQSPVRDGGTAAAALQETVALAQAAERLGYRRYWVAEHHNAASFAGTAPEIVVGQIAARTATIRVGSGGVMLSHYAALKVAETFRLLAAFYPDRIDLGIGRAPGSDQRTAVALAYPRALADLDAFPQQVTDLVGFVHRTLPAEHPFAAIAAQPGPVPGGLPALWLLGSSDYSARLAARLGLPFAFADFFGAAGEIGPLVAALYRRQFRPSVYLREPALMVAVHVICAPTDEQAHHIAASMRVAVARLRTGAPSTGLLPPDEAAIREAEVAPGAAVTAFTKHFIEGDPDRVRRALVATAQRYETDELMIATNCYSFQDRLQSYRLIADACAGATVTPAAAR